MTSYLASAFPEWFAAWYTFASAVPFLPSLFFSVVWAFKCPKYNQIQMRQRLVFNAVTLFIAHLVNAVVWQPIVMAW